MQECLCAFPLGSRVPDAGAGNWLREPRGVITAEGPSGSEAELSRSGAGLPPPSRPRLHDKSGGKTLWFH